MQRILSASTPRGGRYYYYQVSASPFCRSLANFYEEHREPYEYLGQTTYYPSVTTVLSVIHKPQIVQWARDIERRSLKARLLTAVSNNAMPADEAQVIQILEDAQKKADLETGEGAAIGKKAHAFIEDLLKSPNPLELTTDDPELEAIERNWKAWYILAKERYDIQFTHIEEPIISTASGFGGTIDAVAKVKVKGEEKVVVLDWKTSKAFHNEYAMQIAAYAKAYEEMFAIPVYSAIIIRIDKSNNKYESKKVKDIARAYGSFLTVLDVWKMKNADLFS